MIDNLRAAIKAAIPDLTDDQVRAASDLLNALAPPMDEPKWPGAPVIATCPGYGHQRLHTRRNDGPLSAWECRHSCSLTAWESLGNPRPLTSDEYREHGIPMPCEPITDDLIARCAKAAWYATQGNWRHSDDIRDVLHAAGHPEVTR